MYLSLLDDSNKKTIDTHTIKMLFGMALGIIITCCICICIFCICCCIKKNTKRYTTFLTD